MRISKQTRKAIAGQSVAGLAHFKDEQGKRLHPKAIGAEIQRRVKQHTASHPQIRKHAAKLASRILELHLVDHVIIGAPAPGRNRYFSFKETGAIPS